MYKAIDPDLQFPQEHEWPLSSQRELRKNVIEVNYIGKHAVHLLGGYNVNQANIFASIPGLSETNFLDAFNKVRASSTYNSPMINLLMSGSASNNGGTARFRALNTANISGNVAGRCNRFAKDLWVADVTAESAPTRRSISDRDINGFVSCRSHIRNSLVASMSLTTLLTITGCN
jgi:hypothetical protein